VKKKILITSVYMGIGGIETSLINFLNNIDYEKYDVDLILLKKSGDNLTNVPKNISIFTPTDFHNKIFNKLLKKDHFLSKIIRRFIFKRSNAHKYVPKKEYDVAIAFAGYHYFIDMIAGHANAKKKYIWLHTDLKYLCDNDDRYKNHFLKTKDKYEYFDTIIGVSESLIEKFKELLNLKNKEYNYVWNMVPSIQNNEKVTLDGEYKVIMVGRLVKQKGCDRFVDICEKVIKENDKIHFYVVGDGEEKVIIEKAREEKKLESNIHLLGQKKSAIPYIRESDLVLSTSYYEGFHIVLVEGLALNVPFITPKITGAIDVAKYIAPKNSAIICESNVDALAKAVLDAYNGKVNKNFKFDIDKINKEIVEKFNLVLKGEL